MRSAFPWTLGDVHVVDAARRWAVALDDGGLMFADSHHLTAHRVILREGAASQEVHFHACGAQRLNRPARLFDGLTALAEVAWFVDVVAEAQRGVVGQQLQRDGQQDGVEFGFVLGHGDPCDVEVAEVDLVVGDDEDGASPGQDLLHRSQIAVTSSSAGTIAMVGTAASIRASGPCLSSEV